MKGIKTMSEVIVKMVKDRVKVTGGEYVRDLVKCENCMKKDPFCEIHDIYGVEWCSLGTSVEE